MSLQIHPKTELATESEEKEEKIECQRSWKSEIHNLIYFCDFSAKSERQLLAA